MKGLWKPLAISTVVTLVQFWTNLPTRAATLFTSDLDSSQEVDPGGATNSSATGFSNLELFESTPGTFSLNYSLTVSSDINFEPVASGTPVDEITEANDAILLHIHNAPSGVNGPVVFGIFNPNDDNDPNVTFNNDGSTTISGVWEPDEGSEPLSNFVPQLLAATPGEDVDLYWNLHTVADPAGAIRGQLVAVAASEARVPEPSSLKALMLLSSIGFLLRQRPRR